MSYIERQLTSLVMREIKIKITMRNYYVPIRMIKMKKKKILTTPTAGEERETGTSHFAGGNTKWYYHFGKPICSVF